MNVTVFDVPADVVIVTGTGPGAELGGTVTVHIVWEGQLVEATRPANVATICPSELKKLEPAT